MSEPKVIIAGWIRVDPKKRNEAVASFEDLMRRARKAPGCLDLAITADPLDPGRVNLFEFWRSEKDWSSWRRVAGPHRKVARPLQMKVQKHIIQKSGRPF